MDWGAVKSVIELAEKIGLQGVLSVGLLLLAYFMVRIVSDVVKMLQEYVKSLQVLNTTVQELRSMVVGIIGSCVLYSHDCKEEAERVLQTLVKDEPSPEDTEEKTHD